MFKINMHKAGNGDCISITTHSEFILIDGGTAQSFDVWKHQVIGKVAKIDALIITHIDNDHVNGLIRLIEHENCPPIKNIYFNGAEQLFGKSISCSEESRRVIIKLNALVSEALPTSDKEEIGYSEATSISFLISDKKFKCNEVVQGQVISQTSCSKFNVGSLKFLTVSPEEEVVCQLKHAWAERLNEKNIKPKVISKTYHMAFDTFINQISNLKIHSHPIATTKQMSIQSLADSIYEDDTSLSNKSSFAFLIQHNEKNILYLGDCSSRTVENWLDINGFFTIKVDAVKISHHGSKYNTSLGLLKRIDCNKFLISTNGKVHNHPDLETLARIAVVNKCGGAEIIINYDISHIPQWFINELCKSYPNVKILMDQSEVYL